MNSGIFDRIKAAFMSWIDPRPEIRNGEQKHSTPDQKKSDRKVQFSDVEIGGGKEKGQSISAKEEKLAAERKQRDRFIADMHANVEKDGVAADFVPLTGMPSGYDRLNDAQQRWYFYWRSEVRAGRYPDTSEAYIMIYAQEILNGCGWKDAAGGLDSLVKLWTNYRGRLPQLDKSLFVWSLVFARQHQVDYAPDTIAEIPAEACPAIRNLLIDRHREEKPLRLSMTLIKEISAYPIWASRFSIDGRSQLIDEVAPRVVALADAALLKKDGKGILQRYGPRVGKKLRYSMYAGAAHPFADQKITVTVRSYTGETALHKYIGELLRHTENVLRSVDKYRGRLRVENLDPEMMGLIESFLKKEYAQVGKRESENRQVQISLDFKSIDALRIQSNAVREALMVDEEPDEPEKTMPADAETPIQVVDSDDRTGTHAEKSVCFNEEMLSDPLRKLVAMLTETQQEAVRIVLTSEDILEQLGVLAEKAFTMPEILIDEINEAASQALDDMLIDAFGDAPLVLEQYENELRKAII